MVEFRATVRRVPSRRSWLAGVLCALTLAAVPSAPGQRVPGQLNTEVYGRGVGSVRQTGMASLGNVPWNMGTLPSEYRHDVVLSGRLRSEIRGEYLLKGPMAPGGMRSYIPTSPMPYGSASPYSTRPRPTAGVPAGRPIAPAGGGVQAAPTAYTGLLHGRGNAGIGAIRAAPAAAPPSGASAAPTGVAPPLVRPSYGSVRHPPPTTAPAAGLVVPPRVDSAR